MKNILALLWIITLTIVNAMAIYGIIVLTNVSFLRKVISFIILLSFDILEIRIILKDIGWRK